MSCQSDTFNIQTCRECLFNHSGGLGSYTLVEDDENSKFINVRIVEDWGSALQGDSSSFEVNLGNGHSLFLKILADVNKRKIKLFKAGDHSGFEEINIDRMKSKLVVSTESNGGFQVSGLIEGVIFFEEPETRLHSKSRYLLSFYAVKKDEGKHQDYWPYEY